MTRIGGSRGRWLLFLPLWGSFAVLQAETPAPSRSEAVEILDLLPERFSRSTLQDRLERWVKVPFQLVGVDERFLQALRWSTPASSLDTCHKLATPWLQHLVETGLVRAPELEAELPSLLLEQARVLLQLERPLEALQSLQGVRQLVPCSQAPLPNEQISQMFWYEALAHAHMKDGIEDDAFQDALAIAPDLSLPLRVPAAVRQSYQNAQRVARKVRPLHIDDSGFEGEVFLDGHPVTPASQIRPGRHVLQVVGEGGALRSDLISVPKEEPVRLSLLMPLELPSRDRVQEALTSSLRAKQLQPYQTRTLDTYLARRELDILAFVVEKPGSSTPELRVYRAGIGLVDVRAVRFAWKHQARDRVRVEALPTPAFSLESRYRPVLGAPAVAVENTQGIGYGARVDVGLERWLVSLHVGGTPRREALSFGSGVCLEGNTGEDAPFIAPNPRTDIYERRSFAKDPRTDMYERRSFAKDPRTDMYGRRFAATSSSSTAEESSSATKGCVSARSSFDAALSLSLPVTLRSRLWLVPALGLEGAYMPDLVLSDSTRADGDRLRLATLIPIGPAGWLELRYALRSESPSLHLSAALSAAALFAREPGRWWAAFPVGGTISAGAAF